MGPASKVRLTRVSSRSVSSSCRRIRLLPERPDRHREEARRRRRRGRSPSVPGSGTSPIPASMMPSTRAVSWRYAARRIVVAPSEPSVEGCPVDSRAPGDVVGARAAYARDGDLLEGGLEDRLVRGGGHVTSLPDLFSCNKSCCIVARHECRSHLSEAPVSDPDEADFSGWPTSSSESMLLLGRARPCSTSWPCSAWVAAWPSTATTLDAAGRPAAHDADLRLRDDAGHARGARGRAADGQPRCTGPSAARATRRTTATCSCGWRRRWRRTGSSSTRRSTGRCPRPPRSASTATPGCSGPPCRSARRTGRRRTPTSSGTGTGRLAERLSSEAAGARLRAQAALEQGAAVVPATGQRAAVPDDRATSRRRSARSSG